MPNIDILLIEDNIEDSIWVGIQLKRAGTIPYTLHTCDYFSKAMNLLQTNKFSIIILDLCLPDSKGLDTLKSFVKNSNLPIIIYTGISNHDIKEEAFKAGIADYLVKGKTTAEELNKSIVACLAKAKR